MRIYFDHSATTPTDKRVLKEMMPYFSEKFGNASSLHMFGQIAAEGVDIARIQLAKFLDCEPEEVIFTSGATEADNLAIKGVIKAWRAKYPNKKPHIITSVIEHDAVLQPALELEKEGAEVTFLPVKPNGVIDPEEFKKALKENTVLVSIMYVNSEVGSIQPIREIGKIIEKRNKEKETAWRRLRLKERGEKPYPIYFHTDATQALNFLPCGTKHLHVDLLSLSAHKIYGPKGIGALFVKKGTQIKPIQLGGHHEKNLRSGTLNVPGIVGLGKAVSLLDEKSVEKNNKKIARMRDQLVKGILNNIPDVVFNTDIKCATPSHAHFSFLGVEGESILIALDLEGIAVSTGSACASGSLKASHVLVAMGIKVEVAHNSIRFTLGKNNTPEEIKKVIKVLPLIVERFRKMNPDYKK